jgi:hypothetical protein
MPPALQPVIPVGMLYHLLVLNREACPPNADIGGVDRRALLYKTYHGRNGYLIAIYTSPAEGAVFPVLPRGSRVIVNLSSYHKDILLWYIDSAAFKRFVSNRTIIRQLHDALK